MKIVNKLVRRILTMLTKLKFKVKIRLQRLVIKIAQRHGVKLHDRRSTIQILKDLKTEKRQKLEKNF